MADAIAEAPPEIAASGAPVVPSVEINACDVCGALEHTEIASGYDYELITCRNEWHYVSCDSCGHVWLDPRPSPEALGTIYPPTYYAYNYADIPAIARKGKDDLDSMKIGKILKLAGKAPDRYLDVGCGDGRYLDALHRKGVPNEGLFGLELDEATVATLRERGLQAYCERVETTDKFADGSIDLITMFHVIEHVASPSEVVEKLASLLRPGGVLALETPNIDSLDARLFHDGHWGGYHIPRHWHLFKPDTLKRLLEQTGLRVEAVKYQTGHAFWMYSFHHALRYADKPRPKLAKLFDPLNSTIPLIGFTGFDRVRATVGAKTSAMLFVARKEG